MVRLEEDPDALRLHEERFRCGWHWESRKLRQSTPVSRTLSRTWSRRGLHFLGQQQPELNVGAESFGLVLVMRDDDFRRQEFIGGHQRHTSVLLD